MSEAASRSMSRVHAPVTMVGLQPYQAVHDTLSGLSKWRIWMSLSWQEFSSTYRRSALGVLWVMISFAGFIFVKITVFSSLLDTPDAALYNAFLVIGFFVWMNLQQSVSGAPDTFVAAQGWIRTEPLPFSLYIFKNIMRESYNFVLTFFVMVMGLIYLKWSVTMAALYAVPAVFFYALSAYSYKLLLGLISARLRDFGHLIKAAMMPLMFLTPIFWMPEQMPGLMKYMWWNPFYHMIEIFRAPLLTGQFPVESWIFVSILYAAVSLVAFVAFARFRQRIVFWF